MGKQRVKKQQKKTLKKQANLKVKPGRGKPAPNAREDSLLSIGALSASLDEAATAVKPAKRGTVQVKSNKKRRNVGASETAQLNAVLQDAAFRKDPTGAIRQHLTALRDRKREAEKQGR